MKVVVPVPPLPTGRVPVTSVVRSTEVPRVEAMVIEPAPFVTVMPEPCVRAAATGAAPVLPMRSWPLVGAVVVVSKPPVPE